MGGGESSQHLAVCVCSVEVQPSRLAVPLSSRHTPPALVQVAADETLQRVAQEDHREPVRSPVERAEGLVALVACIVDLSLLEIDEKQLTQPAWQPPPIPSRPPWSRQKNSRHCVVPIFSMLHIAVGAGRREANACHPPRKPDLAPSASRSSVCTHHGNGPLDDMLCID